MFGSLVLVFPTPHEGGELVLRHDSKDWTFDAAHILSGTARSVAYIAFFSDVEHEVLPVKSGHRVTLTYNLYYGPDPEDPVPEDTLPLPQPSLDVRAPPHANTSAVRTALKALLDDPSTVGLAADVRRYG